MEKISRKINFLFRIERAKIESFSISDLERSFGFSKPQTDLRELLKVLENNNILTLIKSKPVKEYKLNYKLLDKYIEELPIWKLITNRIKRTRVIWDAL